MRIATFSPRYTTYTVYFSEHAFQTVTEHMRLTKQPKSLSLRLFLILLVLDPVVHVVLLAGDQVPWLILGDEVRDA